MLHAGLDLSRKRIDVCLLSEQGELIEELACPPDRDGLRGLARRVGVHDEPVVGVIESMTGARFVHDTLESLRLGGRDRRCPEGQGPGAAGREDRPDRRPGARNALPARPGAGDLAARSEDQGGARAGPLPAPPGEAPIAAEEPHPLGADQLRASLPGHRPLRGGGARAARKAGGAGALGGQRAGERLPDRRSSRPRSRRSTAGCARAAPTTPTFRGC